MMFSMRSVQYTSPSQMLRSGLHDKRQKNTRQDGFFTFVNKYILLLANLYYYNNNNHSRTKRSIRHNGRESTTV